MRVAAYQAPYLPFGSLDAVALIAEQARDCARQGVDVLCCPESVVGGLALESTGDDPGDVALTVHNGQLAEVLAPVLAEPVTTIVGFTERAVDGALYSSAAVLAEGRVASVYRKVYPGYRTVIQAGADLPLLHHRGTPYGIVICNDLWYVEPARILTMAGAAVLFVPTHSGHQRELSPAFQARGANLAVARAVENTLTVVVADVAGQVGDRLTAGFTAIVDPDGATMVRADAGRPGLAIADVEPVRRPERDPRGRDGHLNPVVTQRFLALWAAPPTR